LIIRKTDAVYTSSSNIEKPIHKSIGRMLSDYNLSCDEFCEKTSCKDTQLTCSANGFNSVQVASEYLKKMAFHVIQCYSSKHWCLFTFTNSRKKPYILTGCILCSLLVFLLIVSCIVLLCMSSMIQHYLNSTSIQVLSSVLTRPKASQFDFDFTTRVQRQTSLPFLLHTFKANVFYLPKNNISSNSSVQEIESLSLLKKQHCLCLVRFVLYKSHSCLPIDLFQNL
jgi:hypothetical protein